jgi:hypothetical protein
MEQNNTKISQFEFAFLQIADPEEAERLMKSGGVYTRNEEITNREENMRSKVENITSRMKRINPSQMKFRGHE